MKSLPLAKGFEALVDSSDFEVLPRLKSTGPGARLNFPSNQEVARRACAARKSPGTLQQQ